MEIEIITRADLEVFGRNLIKEIKDVLDKSPDKHSKWLKGPEVMRLLKIKSYGTLQNLRISGKIAFRKIGGTYYYDFKEIEKMLCLEKGK